MKELKKLKIKEYHIKIIFILVVFIFCFITSTKIKFGNAPDEQMKMLICDYIEEHNKLPQGGENEVVNTTWGVSYAFTPILSYLISAIFTGIVKVFTSNDIVLLAAVRFISVLCYTGMAIMVMLIGEKLLKNKVSKWLFIVLVTCLPQMMFLGSYLNNDSLALFSISLIIYSWIIGLESKWNYKSTILLGIAIGICALSYYNAYGYILTSIIIYITSYFVNRRNKEKIDVKNLFIKGIIIAVVALLLSGWWFVRSYILYDGDFIGMKTSSEHSEKHAIDEYKPSKRKTPKNVGTEIFTMLISDGWIKETTKSFIGVFGNMSIQMPVIIYYNYLLLYFISFTGVLMYIIKNIKTKVYKNEKMKLLLEMIFIINIIITISLSIYYSYFSDYQPQGRYIMPMLIPYMYFITIGITKVVNSILNITKIKEKIKTKIQKLENIIIIIIIIIIFIIPFIFLPRAWF